MGWHMLSPIGRSFRRFGLRDPHESDGRLSPFCQRLPALAECAVTMALEMALDANDIVESLWREPRPKSSA